MAAVAIDDLPDAVIDAMAHLSGLGYRILIDEEFGRARMQVNYPKRDTVAPMAEMNLLAALFDCAARQIEGEDD